jgi:exopolysaccharide production protein ExoY
MSDVAKVRDQLILNRVSAVPVGGPVKRLIDIILSSIGILALIPLLTLCCVGVFLTSRGPIIYGHRRVGFKGQLFNCLKFRTMVPDADRRLREYLQEYPEAEREWAETRKLRSDPRITWFGGMLRRTSLDELPQLINVLRGDMSLVGPRPVTEDEMPKYATRLPIYLACKPGITGLWQVSGRSNTSYEERVSLDASYAENWTLLLDAKIVVQTLPVVLGSEDAR